MKHTLYFLLAALLVPLILLGMITASANPARTKPAPASAVELTPHQPAATSLSFPPPPTTPSQGPSAWRARLPRANAWLYEGAQTDPAPDTDAPSGLLCGGPPVMTILAVGADNRDDTYLYGLADVIRIVRVDFLTPKISIFSLPRDLWVEIPEIEDHYGITHGKLNQAYLYGGPGMGYYDGPGGGAGLLARTLAVNFGFTVDHFVSVNMVTFVKIVDSVDGIDVDIPEPVDGRPPYSWGQEDQYFSAGPHHFDGQDALRFARLRTNYDDLARIEHQTMVLTALQTKLLSPSVLDDIPEIIAALKDSLLTDLRLSEIVQLACLASQLQRENIEFINLPQDILEPGREYSPHFKKTVSVYHADFDLIRAMLETFKAGRTADPTHLPPTIQ